MLKENTSKDPTVYWRLLKGRDDDKDNSSLTLGIFYDHFNLSENLVDEHIRLPESDASEIREIHLLNDPITVYEVLKAIGKLKSDKAPGYDDIVNEYIKCTKNILYVFYP